MSINATQRLTIPKKDNPNSRNCLLKSNTNVKNNDYIKCVQYAQINLCNQSINTINQSTSKKFVAPVPLSKSTTLEKKYKPIVAQLNDRNFKNIKNNLNEKFNNNKSVVFRENLNVSQSTRKNKFNIKANKNKNFLIIKDGVKTHRDRSRSIRSKKGINQTADKNKNKKDNCKTTPIESSVSHISDKNQSILIDKEANYLDNMTKFKVGNEDFVHNKENRNSPITNVMQTNTITTVANESDFKNFMKKEEEIQIDFSLVSDLKKGGGIDLKINNSVDFIFGNTKTNDDIGGSLVSGRNTLYNSLEAENKNVSRMDTNKIIITNNSKKLQEIHMKDEFIFSQGHEFQELKEKVTKNISSNIFTDNSQKDITMGSSLNNSRVYFQQNYECSIPLNTSAKNELRLPKGVNYNFIQENINKINLGLFTLSYENLKTNRENSSKFTKQEYRRLLTTFLNFEYGKNILDELYNSEECITNPLNKHEISERMRTRMVDWMIEVLSNYKCDESTYFLSVNVMDRYFRLCTEQLKPDDLHLIGICSMFISSKYYDVYPIKLKLITEKVAHNKFSPDEIKNMEENIIKTIGYALHKPTVYDFVNFYIEEIFYFVENNFIITDETLSAYLKLYCAKDDTENKSEVYYYEKYKHTRKYTHNLLNLLRNVVIYLAKMNCHDNSLTAEKPSLLAASSLLVGMKICEQMNNEEYINEYFTNKLCEVSRNNEYEILNKAQKILYNAQNFDMLYSGLENLKRVHFNYILELKDIR